MAHKQTVVFLVVLLLVFISMDPADARGRTKGNGQLRQSGTKGQVDIFSGIMKRNVRDTESRQVWSLFTIRHTAKHLTS
jgi:hypothetical protein